MAKRAVSSSDDEVSPGPSTKVKKVQNGKEGKKVESESEVEQEDDESEKEDIMIVDDEDEAPKSKAKGKGKSAGRTAKATTGGKKENLDLSLPPMSNIYDIFDDLTKPFAEDLAKVFKKLNRSLRIATMCSGTEAPILALRLLFRALEAQTGIKASMHHIFSAEIEPYKQAYIERNFAPPILFRDVTELPKDEARTAYGAMVPVPGDADILVAGTSCVDYSNLNGMKKGIHDGGESGRTFFGMLQWVDKHRPPIVILENVLGAPWDDGIKAFADIGYSAAWTRLDTKKYYIPHTRTRGYLFAYPNGEAKGSNFFKPKSSTSNLGDLWSERVRNAARPASSPTEAFLLDSDDPRIHRARSEYTNAKVKQDGSQRAPPEWVKCQQRHAQARHEERLGKKRPLTDWQDNGGKPTLPDGGWQDWAESQTERVWDLMDISYLRQATEGVDIAYKSAIWELSQNVDRGTFSKVYGITPCLTPGMIPYLTNRGGSVTGLEALALQGLPIDELILTRESTDQLANLAGNAMSSTVVGSAIASALCVAGRLLLEREYGNDVDAEMETSAVPTEKELEARFRGFEHLVAHPVDLASVKPLPSDILKRAQHSARSCTCEGRQGTSKHPIVVCQGCGYSSCKEHAGKPEHYYKPFEGERELPVQFEADLKEFMPMRVTVPGFEREALEKLVEAATEYGAKFDTSMLKRYLDVVIGGMQGAEFHFRRAERREIWKAIYESEKTRLELRFAPTGLEWQLFATPPSDLGMLDALRRDLERPFARLNLGTDPKDLFSGAWEVKLPLSGTSSSLTMSFDGKPWVPSWRSSLGLKDFKQEKRPEQIKVSFKGAKTLLSRDIDGVYELKPHCKTACNALYRRIEPAEDIPLFFFFDPTAYLQQEQDSFVFAESCEQSNTARELVASLKPVWRIPTDPEEAELRRFAEPEVVLQQVWSVLDGSAVIAGGLEVGEESSFSTIKTGSPLSAAAEQCSQAEALLVAKVPLAKAPSTVWANENWHEVDLLHEGAEVFSKLNWVIARIPEWDSLAQWQSVAADTVPGETCQCCAPNMPAARWIRQLVLGIKTWSTKIIAREDGLESAAYERALKDRPEPVIVHTRQQGTDFQFRVGLNAVSLAHRAVAQLPESTREIRYKRTKPEVEWRLTTSSNIELGPETKCKFSLPDNREDPPAKNPDLFVKHKLRKEQLRSLHWMIQQEENPQPWIEEEVAEAVLPQLGWHAEAKATRKAYVRGGVVADDVGYGKTAITLGLIAVRREADADLPDEDDRIPIKATLVVVPAHLPGQWASEAKKFTKSALEVLTIKNMTELKKATIQKFMDADIIVVSETVFNSAIFWPHLADFAASTKDIKTDEKAGRYFRYTVQETLNDLGSQCKVLVEEGAAAAQKAITRARKNRKEDFQQEEYIPASRRAANAKAREAAEKDGKKYKPEKLPPKPTSFGRARNEDVNDKDWQLETPEVKRDYRRVKSPPLALFSYARVVVDEFSYSKGSSLVGIHSLRGRSRWILSGTPPLDDFSHVKFIADMLHIHLGSDDDNEGTHKAVEIRQKERTKAEEFRSFCDVRTKPWHARRNQVAQRFLNQFARQNKAEIDEIPLVKELIGVRLPGAEMAIYRELEHHLFAIDPNLAKIAKIKQKYEGDRDKRLRQALGQSMTPEEALLKRCSHFSLDLPAEMAESGQAPDVCDYIHDVRDEQLAQCRDQLERHLAIVAYKHRKAIAKGYYEKRVTDTKTLQKWAREVDSGFGDAEADETITELARRVGIAGGKIANPTEEAYEVLDTDVADFNKPAESAAKYDDWVAARTWSITDDCASLRKLVSELVGRFRSRRYFNAVRNVFRGTGENVGEDHIILSCCGHEGPASEVEKAVAGECFVEKCDANVGFHNIIRGDDLGTDRPSGHFGYKLETLITLIEETPEEDHVLVFVQFQDLYNKVHEALTVYGISTTVITGSSAQQVKALDAYQKGGSDGTKVLLLLATDSSASGANLTIANHAFFVSPLLTDTQSNYNALSTQAIGRIRRFGQLKTANIIHLLVQGTMDMRVYGTRNGICDDKDNTYSQNMAAYLDEQPNKRDEIVNPPREKEHEWTAPNTKATKKAAADVEAKPKSPAKKGKAAAAVEVPDIVPKYKGRKAAPAPSKSRTSKVASPVVDSDDEGVASSSEEEEDVMETEDESDAESVASHKGKGKGKLKDEDDFEIDLTNDDSPAAKRTVSRRASALQTPKYAVDDDEDEDDQMSDLGERSPSPSPAGKKRKRLIVVSDDEDDEASPVALTAKAKGKSKSASTSSPSSIPVKKTKEVVPAAKRRKSTLPEPVLEIVSPAPSPKKRKSKVKAAAPAPAPKAKKAMVPGTLDGFFTKKPAAPKRASTASTSVSKEPSPLLASEEESDRPLETPATEVDRQLGVEKDEMAVDDDEA
ncbi:hypothetical protein JCM11251_005244 [Rhodosporidiobolus azoricus]